MTMNTHCMTCNKHIASSEEQCHGCFTARLYKRIYHPTNGGRLVSPYFYAGELFRNRQNKNVFEPVDAKIGLEIEKKLNENAKILIWGCLSRRIGINDVCTIITSFLNTNDNLHFVTDLNNNLLYCRKINNFIYAPIKLSLVSGITQAQATELKASKNICAFDFSKSSQNPVITSSLEIMKHVRSVGGFTRLGERTELNMNIVQ